MGDEVKLRYGPDVKYPETKLESNTLRTNLSFQVVKIQIILI